MIERWIYVFICILTSVYITACSYLKKETVAGQSFYQKLHILKGFKVTTKNSLSTNIKFSPNGELIAVYQALDNNQATIKIWNTHTGKLTYKTKVGGIKGYDDRTAQTSINFLPEGTALILDGQIGPIVRWDFTHSKETKNICAGEYTSFVSISDDRQYIHMHTLPGSDFLCSANDNTVYYAGRFSGAHVTLTKNNKLLAVYPSAFTPYHIKNDPYGTEIPRQYVEYNNYFPLEKSMKYIDIRENGSPDTSIHGNDDARISQYNISNSHKKSLSLWDSSTKELIKLRADGDFFYNIVKNNKMLKNSQYLITFSPDGKTIAVSRENKQLTLWQLIEKPNKLLNLTASTAHFLCVRYRSLSHKKCAVLAPS